MAPEGCDAAILEDAFRSERRTLWRLCYRLTGSASDADDAVQETFLRLLEHPPRALDELRPWLARVATRIGIDALRRRRRRAYVGPWLPAPIDTEGEEWLETVPAADAGATPEARYGLLESVSYAFLLALEALSPRQRAILVLRDVLDYSARETARILDTTEANVRIVHHRARRAMQAYDVARCVPTRELRERTRHALETFLACLVRGDARGLEGLLTASVRTVTDGGGAYTALNAPLTGRDRVARFYVQAAQNRQAGEPRIEIRLLNGLPTALIVLARPVRRQAPRTVLRCEIGEDGRIREIHSVLAPAKLGAVGFGA
jgi:RNA polymerase sigma-70 factor (ECF subfamily)